MKKTIVVVLLIVISLMFCAHGSAANLQGVYDHHSILFDEIDHDAELNIDEEGELRKPLATSVTYSFPDNATSFNCYGYANGTYNNIYPGTYSGNSFNASTSISTFASIVKSDLKSTMFGHYLVNSYTTVYNCVKIQTTRPAYSSTWAGIIATKKSTTNDSFHFALCTPTGWLHKVEIYSIMRFEKSKFVSNDYIWTNACTDEYGNPVGPTTTYNSSIRFILFKANHGTTISEYTGENYHSGSRHYFKYANKCSDCGDTINTYWINIPCNGNPCVGPEKAPVTHESY